MARSSRKALFGVMLGGLAVAASPLVSNEGPRMARVDLPFCSLSVPPLGVSPGITYVLGSFVDRVVDVGPGPIDPTGLPGHVAAPTGDATIWGQYMQLSGAGGWSAESLVGGSGRYAQEVILVLWDYDPSCSVTHYTGAIPFGVPGEQALAHGRLRDRDEWVDGVPTIDTYLGGAMMYPPTSLTERQAFMDWDRGEHPTPRWERQESLSPVEAFELMNMMPEPCEELWSPASFAAKSTVLRLTYLEDGRFPVSRALRTLEERARHPERTRSACLADPREVSLPW